MMKCVLDYLPLLLQNKTLVLSTAGNLVDVLCNNLCAMVSELCPLNALVIFIYVHSELLDLSLRGPNSP